MGASSFCLYTPRLAEIIPVILKMLTVMDRITLNFLQFIPILFTPDEVYNLSPEVVEHLDKNSGYNKREMFPV